jgi:hypothetical protein
MHIAEANFPELHRKPLISEALGMELHFRMSLLAHEVDISLVSHIYSRRITKF